VVPSTSTACTDATTCAHCSGPERDCGAQSHPYRITPIKRDLTVTGITYSVPGEGDEDDVHHENDGGEEGGEEGEDHSNSAEGPGNDAPAGHGECEYYGEEGECTCDWVNDECSCDSFGDYIGGVGVDVQKREEGRLETVA